MDDNLEYCLLLRNTGLTSEQIKLILAEQKLTGPDLHYLLVVSDAIYIEQLIAKKNEKSEKVKPRLFFKTIILFISLFFLLNVFFGAARVSLILLILFWAALRSTAILSNGKKRQTSNSRFNKWRNNWQT